MPEPSRGAADLAAPARRAGPRVNGSFHSLARAGHSRARRAHLPECRNLRDRRCRPERPPGRGGRKVCATSPRKPIANAFSARASFKGVGGVHLPGAPRPAMVPGARPAKCEAFELGTGLLHLARCRAMRDERRPARPSARTSLETWRERVHPAPPSARASAGACTPSACRRAQPVCRRLRPLLHSACAETCARGYDARAPCRLPADPGQFPAPRPVARCTSLGKAGQMRGCHARD